MTVASSQKQFLPPRPATTHPAPGFVVQASMEDVRMLAAGPLCRLSCHGRAVQSAVCIHLSPSGRKYQAGVVMPAGASMQKRPCNSARVLPS